MLRYIFNICKFSEWSDTFSSLVNSGVGLSSSGGSSVGAGVSFEMDTDSPLNSYMSVTVSSPVSSGVGLSSAGVSRFSVETATDSPLKSSHSFIVPSSLPDAMTLPSGEKARELTSPLHNHSQN